jgi:DNA-binding Lrp family transcriptional regulator
VDPDFALLCAVRDKPLDGPASWARQANLDQSSARRRLKKLQANGALQGFSAIPDAKVFGRAYTPHQFDAPDGCDEKAILEVPDVAWYARTLDGNLYVVTYEDGVSRRQELEELLGPNVGTFDHAESADAVVLGRIEFKVMRELLLDPRATIAELCTRTALSTKTVRAHRAALVANQLVAIDPLLRTPTTPGRLFYNLSVRVDSLAARQPVAKEIENAVLVNYFDEPPACYMFATAGDLVAQGNHLQAIRAVPRVTDVRVIVNQEFGVATKRLVGWCDAAIAAWTLKNSK